MRSFFCGNLEERGGQLSNGAYDGYLVFNTQLEHQEFERGVKSLSDIASKGAKIVAGVFAATAGTVTALGGAAVKVGMEFETAMSQVAATMGMTTDEVARGSKEFAMLEDAAKQAGATTKFTASEAAEALNYLALAGYSAAQSAEALPVVLNLAAAGGMDLAYASDLATDAMAALGIEANKENLTAFGDQLAKASSKANTSVAQLGEAILTVGGNAKNMAGGTTELNSVLGVMANRGIKGSEAGTHLRQILQSLTDPTTEAKKTMEKLGLSFYDAEGKLRPLNESFADMYHAMSSFTDEEKAVALTKMFNSRDMAAAQALLAGVGDEYNNLFEAIENSGGAMQNMADVQIDNLKGKMTILGSALEGLGIQVYEKLESPLKEAAEVATRSVDVLAANLARGKLSESVDSLAKSVGSLMQRVSTFATQAVPKMVNGLSFTLDHTKELTGAIKLAVGAVVAWKAVHVFGEVKAAWSVASTAVAAHARAWNLATTAVRAHVAMQEMEMVAASGSLTLRQIISGVMTRQIGLQLALNAAVAAHPFAFVLGVVAATTAAYVLLTRSQEDVSAKSKELTQTLETEKKSWDDLQTAQVHRIESQTADIRNTQEMVEELENLIDADGKVLDSKERVKYIVDQINEVAPDSIQWIDDETLAIEGNIEALKRQMKMKEAVLVLEQLEADNAKIKEARIESLNQMTEWKNQIAESEAKISEMEQEMAKTTSQAKIDSLAIQREAEYIRLNELKDNLTEEQTLFQEHNQSLDHTSRLRVAIAENDMEEASRIMAEMQLDLKKAGDSSTAALKTQIAEKQEQYDTLLGMISESSTEAEKALLAELGKILDEYKGELEARTTTLGGDMVSGVVTGIQNGQGAIGSAFSNALQVAVQQGRRSIESNSPSKLTARILGEPMAEGVAVGIDNKSSLVSKSLAKMSADAVEVVRAKATNFKEMGSIYLKEMKKGIDSQVDDNIEAMEEIVDKMVDAEIKRLGKKNTEAKSAYKEAAKELMKTYKTSLKEGANEAYDVISERMTAITEEAQKQYDEVLKKQGTMEKKLSSFGDVFFYDEETGKLQLKNLEDNIDALERYDAALKALKDDKHVSDEFLGMVTDLGVEDGTAYAEKLLKQSDAKFEEHVRNWEEQQALAKEIAEKHYKNELTRIEETLSGDWATTMEGIPVLGADLGTDTMQGVIDGMNGKKADAVSTAKDIADAIIAELQRAMDIHSPSRKTKKLVGAPMIEGVFVGAEEAYEQQKQRLRVISENLMADIGYSQQRIGASASNQTSYATTTSNVTHKQGDINFHVDKMVNDGKGSIAGLAREFEVYRQQKAVGTGG